MLSSAMSFLPMWGLRASPIMGLWVQLWEAKKAFTAAGTRVPLGPVHSDR